MTTSSTRRPGNRNFDITYPQETEISVPTTPATVATWMPRDYTPMMMAYNTMNGNISPSGAGPASAVSIMMALVAGVLAMIYALVQRKAD